MEFVDPYRRRHLNTNNVDGWIICPFCQLECEGAQELKAHLMGQHQGEKVDIDMDRLQEIIDWKNGKTNAIDI